MTHHEEDTMHSTNQTWLVGRVYDPRGVAPVRWMVYRWLPNGQKLTAGTFRDEDYAYRHAAKLDKGA